MSQERIAAVVDHPLHAHLGVTAIEAAEGAARLRAAVGPDSVNPAGVLHGGVLYLLCDVCAYAGLLSALDAATEAVTHDIHVSVLRPAPAGTVVDYVSTPLKIGRNTAFIDVEASVEGRAIARARVTKTLIAT